MSDLSMTRGDTPTWRIAVHDADGAAFNLSDCAIWLTCKASRADADADAIFQLTTAAGSIAITDAAGGLCEATPAAADTSTLTGRLVAVYDVQVRTTDSKTYTVADGKLTIAADVTRA